MLFFLPEFQLLLKEADEYKEISKLNVSGIDDLNVT